MLMPDGYMMVILTAEGRQPANTEADRARAFKSMFAYSGKYTFDGDNFVTDVDVASLVEWTGAEQVRTCRFVGSRLQFISKRQVRTCSAPVHSTNDATSTSVTKLSPSNRFA